MAVYLDFAATSEYTSRYVRPTTYTAPSGPMGTPLAGQHMVQPAQQGIHWHPSYGQHPPMPVPPQQPHQQAYPFPIATLRLLSYAGQLIYLNKVHLCSFLKIALNHWCLNFKYLVRVQSKNRQHTQFPCHTNNNLLFQSQRRQQLYLPHIKNFKQQPQKILAWTSKPWKTDLMLLLRRSLRTWLHP